MILYALDDLVSPLPERPTRPVVERIAWEGPERPGDEFNRLHSEQEILEWLEFTLGHSDFQGDHYTRPGKDTRDGSSATVYTDTEGSHVTIWSDTCVQMWPALEVRVPYDAFGLFVCTHFNGDFSAAARSLADQGYGELPQRGPDLIDELEEYLSSNSAPDEGGEPTGWEPIDLVEALKKGPPPPPDLLRRTDGIFMLYRRKIHYFYGPSESLKSWGAQLATVHAVRAGGTAVYIDFENDPYSFMERIAAFGVTKDDEIRRIIYLAPDRPFTDKATRDLGKILRAGADLVVVDGVSNAMNLLGLNPMDHAGNVEFEMKFLRPLTGSNGAVVAIDHSPKKEEGTLTLFGGQHKKAAVTGASFSFNLTQPFGRGLRGIARLFLDKDKPGFLRQHADNGFIAELHLTSGNDGTVFGELVPPGVDPLHRPTGIMESLSRWVEKNAGLSEQLGKQNGTNSLKLNYVNYAWQLLESEGYIINDMGALGWRSIKPYREEPELFAELETAPQKFKDEKDEASWERMRKFTASQFPQSGLSAEELLGEPPESGTTVFLGDGALGSEWDPFSK